MKLTTFLSQLPPGGRSDFAKHIGASPAYLYQMVRGIRPIPPTRALAICEATNWKVTPHELRPDIYPNPSDGLPTDRLADLIASGVIKPNPADEGTRTSGSGYLYSDECKERREKERREAERRKQERRKAERRS
ncbi:YdaS family helix-turn-helix protein [Marinobacter sp. X15-166B]|uniref:transcriptional regulator n=1 Tax=Marinobacter sp. X15-166B TaxID=1897620 RepID=UPI0009F22843